MTYVQQVGKFEAVQWSGVPADFTTFSSTIDPTSSHHVTLNVDNTVSYMMVMPQVIPISGWAVSGPYTATFPGWATTGVNQIMDNSVFSATFVVQ